MRLCAWRGSNTRTDVKAKLRFQVQTPNGPKEKSLTVKNGSDLYELSDNRAAYKDGFYCEARLTPLRERSLSALIAGLSCRWGRNKAAYGMRFGSLQIRKTVKKHLGQRASGAGAGAEGPKPVLYRSRGELSPATKAAK